ncbi:hypothetical protein [Nitrosomonas eutropha]|nr:hypothetical protein [Nitrosomonas eutropha]
MFSLPVLAGFFLALASAVTIAAGSGADDSTWQPFVMQASIPPKTALAVGVALDQEGWLWLVKMVNQRLLVSRSEDDGRHFSEPATVTPVPENIGNDGEDRLHLTWFTSGTAGQGQFYKRISSDLESKSMALGDADVQPNHAAVVVHGETVILTWREFDGNVYSIRMMFSNDADRTWSEPWRLMLSAGASDYPVPLISNDKALIVWNTENEGLRILPVERVITRSSS